MCCAQGLLECGARPVLHKRGPLILEAHLELRGDSESRATQCALTNALTGRGRLTSPFRYRAAFRCFACPCPFSSPIKRRSSRPRATLQGVPKRASRVKARGKGAPVAMHPQPVPHVTMPSLLCSPPVTLSLPSVPFLHTASALDTHSSNLDPR